MSSREASWKIWVDTGGTFTDCIAVDPTGAIHRAKVLSSSALRGRVESRVDGSTLRVRFGVEMSEDLVRGFELHLLGAAAPASRIRSFDPTEGILELEAPAPSGVAPGTAFEARSPEEAPILAARVATGTPLRRELPPIEMRLATTRGTNALLERRGAPVALFVTRGFRDLLEIGTQQRPDLFALDIRKPSPLHVASIEVRERLTADGSVLEPLGPEELARLRREAASLVSSGVRCAAVALLHGHVNPAHEAMVAAVLREAGFEHASLSSELSPVQGYLTRARTAVVNAYLSPAVERYVDRVSHSIATGSLRVMTSAGGLVDSRAFRARDSLLSGPAGGVCGAALAARRSGFARAIAFDMGGTSTDVARLDVDFEYVFEHEIGDATLSAAALAIESVAAGGGSICCFDGSRLRVGPESAGATPGPACYGEGGPLTITDVNLLLGRLDPSRFVIPLDREPAKARFSELAAKLQGSTGERPAPATLLEGLLEIANERIAGAIRAASVRKGFDPRGYALVAFGGAGGQHACAVAERLEISTIVIPVDAGLLSALGLGDAAIERIAVKQVLDDLARVEALVPDWLLTLEKEAMTGLELEGVPPDSVEIRRRIAGLRYAGQDATLQVEVEGTASLRDAFETRYRGTFGHAPDGRAVELESLRVIASSRRVAPDGRAMALEAHEPAPGGRFSFLAKGATWEAPGFDRAELRPGATIRGPALVFEDHGTTVIEPGWTAGVDAVGALVLRHRVPAPGAGETKSAAPSDAIELELYTNRFRAIVEEMGEMLRRTALSTNVKERLDYSCALLDADGDLIVNAPHIPVHLGALGVCVRSLRGAIAMAAGDVIVTNHPAYGGSHLPDITTVTPVFDGDGRLIAHVATRAHHAEIGGAVPGSMPPHARSLEEEGVLIPPMHLVKGGRARWEELRGLLESGRHPSRSPEENIADLRASVAANQRGLSALASLADANGSDAVRRNMKELKLHAEGRMRAALTRLRPGRLEDEERLDDGSLLRVSIEIGAGQARFDFGGSSQVHSGNLNATEAIVRSVVLYVLRLLVGEPLPLNEGLLAPVDVHVPPGLLNPTFPADASQCPAVFGGNVETSQRLASLLIRALGLAADSQGTMNNVIFGTSSFGYYETVCGGAGAGPTHDGASAVHTHMTNTRITDPEVIEHRYPARVLQFAVRRESGGSGLHRGGDGVVRELEFLAPMTLSVLGQHRNDGPLGLDGGGHGAPASLRLVRRTGETLRLGSAESVRVEPHDRFVLETPGGGGHGRPLQGPQDPGMIRGLPGD